MMNSSFTTQCGRVSTSTISKRDEVPPTILVGRQEQRHCLFFFDPSGTIGKQQQTHCLFFFESSGIKHTKHSTPKVFQEEGTQRTSSAK
jgi:hypothetical protein